jgi:riboflavin synthase
VFTGIVQSLGTVRSLGRQSAGARLVLDAPELERPIADGASIAVNGVCLTATRSDPRQITFDVVHETLARSTLGALQPGDRVNLERSVRIDERLEGHIVQGHADGTAVVTGVRQSGGEQVWSFRVERHLCPYLIPKGSIAVDGVSLTIAEVQGDTFRIALIPATLERTTLGQRRAGDRVNIETDIVARTIVETLRRMTGDGQAQPGGLTVAMLKEQGWSP